jgi:hypothetical protein
MPSKSLNKPCKNCGRDFKRTKKWQVVCPDCLIKVNKARSRSMTRQLKGGIKRHVLDTERVNEDYHWDREGKCRDEIRIWWPAKKHSAE